MEELEKLYQARAILATTEHGVSDDLKQRISLLEQRIVKERFFDFKIDALKIFDGIESPMSVNIEYHPLSGVSMTFDNQCTTQLYQDKNIQVQNPQASKIVSNDQLIVSDFVRYINDLNITDNSKRRYIKLLTDDYTLSLLRKFARVDELEMITDLNVIYSIIEYISKDERNNVRKLRSLLNNYVIYLKKKGNKEYITPNRPIIRTRGQNRGLIVRFEDGMIINEKRPWETFSKAIAKIGPEKVRKLDFRVCGVPLVSDTKSDNPPYAMAQKPVGSGLYVMTYCSAQNKKNLLDKIAKMLGVRLRVSIIE